MALMSPRYRILCKFAVVMMVVMAIATVNACKTFDPASASSTVVTLNDRIEVMDAAAADPTKTPEQREIARLKAEKYRADRERALALIAEDEAADKPDPNEEVATGIGNAVAAAVPGFGAAIAIGIPVFFRVRRQIAEHKRAEELERLKADSLQTAMTQTVGSIENAKATVPAFASAWDASKLAIEAKQDESTKTIIEKIKTDSKS